MIPGNFKLGATEEEISMLWEEKSCDIAFMSLLPLLGTVLSL
jgi:hypothetical protein